MYSPMQMKQMDWKDWKKSWSMGIWIWKTFTNSQSPSLQQVHLERTTFKTQNENKNDHV